MVSYYAVRALLLFANIEDLGLCCFGWHISEEILKLMCFASFKSPWMISVLGYRVLHIKAGMLELNHHWQTMVGGSF